MYGVVRDYEANSCQDTPTYFTSHKRSKTSETRMHYTHCCAFVVFFRPCSSAWERVYSLTSFGLRLGIERLANVYDLMRWAITSLNILSKLLSYLLRCWQLIALAFGFPFQVYLTRIKPFFVL